MTHTRATREAARQPHLALVNTLTSICQALPRSAEEANYTRANVFKALPSVFQSWFQLILLPAVKQAAQTDRAGNKAVLRNEREARTLVEALDMLLRGEQLPVVMLLLGRLKAISAVVLQENSWTQAETHEVTRTNATGILTSKDLRHAQRDHRDLQRLATGGRGAPPAGRQGDGS